MKNYKKILLAAATSLALSTGVMAAEKLRIGTEGAYPPFNLLDADGNAVGFDLDIAHALCEKMKVECSVVLSDWDGIIPALNARKFDFLIASMSITEERKMAVEFTDRYYSNGLQFIAPKNVDFKVDLDSLKGKTVGVQRATIAGTGWKTTWAARWTSRCMTPTKMPIWIFLPDESMQYLRTSSLTGSGCKAMPARTSNSRATPCLRTMKLPLLYVKATRSWLSV